MKAFKNLHPAVLLCYFFFVLIIGIFSFNPLFLSSSLLGGFLFFLALRESPSDFKGLWGYLILFILIAVTNPLFSHNGATPLFFINDNRVTLEALIFGLVLGLMLLAVLFWFKCFNRVFTSDKILYIFGRFLPGLCLVFSMAIKFIPKLIDEFKQIHTCQKQMSTDKSPLRGYITSFSSVITRSLEESVQTHMSMRARAYGSQKRTHYGIYTFKVYDLCCFALCTALFLLTLAPVAMGFTRVEFYPYYSGIELTPWSAVSYSSYFALSILPFVYEVWGSVKWKFLILKM